LFRISARRPCSNSRRDIKQGNVDYKLHSEAAHSICCVSRGGLDPIKLGVWPAQINSLRL